MIGKFLTSASLAAALALTPAERAEADAGDFIGGAIIGGIIGHAVTQQNQRNRTATTRVVRPGIPATQQGRETQSALNYFGYGAGTVDGQIGPGTRAAIERYQASMGYPVNGREFSSYQFDFLMDAYYWATQQGGAQQTGLRGQSLLYSYRDSLQRGPIQSASPAQQPPATTVIVNPGQPAAPPASTAVTAPAAGQLPNLFANSQPRMSLANACNSVMLQTSSNGGYVTLATMRDPSQALSEQFCVARTYAMAQGEELMGRITGIAPAQIAEQCGAFSAMLSAEIDRVSLIEQAPLAAEMREFAAGTGMPPGDLAATSRVCLAVAYAQDDMRMAVGSALMLVALGEPAYGELLGHHLREGFGTNTRRDLAMQWYDASITALERGSEPAFMPGQPERPALLRAATMQLGGGAPAGAPQPVRAQQPVPALPTFQVNQ
ncbi:peptidoglycan-binding domain-containing protein [Roseibacterium sp. SDUM158017]|uniref:peptidoglycan-binding domain-containing protein n=1 Tax=Roseicyclus salinarum TaxID=3036773 RepID=UPI0024154299|nr:peptidoglycan-binding domain-containing protein [Roseibacterium sp. SDUM158017]MDG4649337.1 peptidoglycan-binding domain-containing protein [Roseibacterium sp. SDUM158017]